MISTGALSRNVIFRTFGESMLKTVARATVEVSCASGEILFECNQPAQAFYLLLSGTLELWLVTTDRNGNGTAHFSPSGEVRAGEVAGISALIPPYIYTATGQATKPSNLLKIDAHVLRSLAAEDPRFDSALMHIVAEATMARLTDARTQLLAYRGAGSPRNGAGRVS